ncbi:uncharacterized protein Z518_02198 [Rhinocladiella mackenziei CBS 650.93]|uniref:ER membrane protein SH3 n=1 Tax=Rhinocladiella mackenziei CBS 650.93 TaxID=1442369 RepID=A0A0D2JEG2_9EURO|nr:uncharacterized protein Z518_02198 [Rhinocladiella mackenziei CBS 650.93]KIX07545.1 hypothetical protein Z518_02198 [Rhinocladiella mackenziei CBS 650.93]
MAFHNLPHLRPIVLFVFGALNIKQDVEGKLTATEAGIGGLRGVANGRVKQVQLKARHLLPFKIMEQATEVASEWIIQQDWEVLLKGPSVSFFLGILFSLFPYDYPLLWSSLPTPSSHFDAIETHLKLLHNAPNLIQRILHIMLSMGILGLLIKLYKPSESNMLFDGGSLVLYMVAVIVYIANIVKGLRIVSEGTYGLINMHELTQDQRDNVDASGYDVDTGDSVLGREDNLKVLAASNTILALVLVGVLVLQVGQWYAERTDERVLREFEAKEKAEREKESEGPNPGVKRQSSGRESKKAK